MAGVVRQPIDVPSLERYLNQHVPAIKTPLDLKQFGFGQSNPTYLLTAADGQKHVLRKKPPGKLLSKTAHRVEREYQIIHALEQTDVPVLRPSACVKMTALSAQLSTSWSFLMDGCLPTPPCQKWKDAARTLAKFHRVDPKSIGMEKFGRASGFYDRQISTFSVISKTQAKAVDVDTKIPVGEIPHFNDMIRFFSNKTTQPQDRATFVHGDYKIDNMVFHKTENRVIGVLDWEMATIGHPLSDLANLTSPYAHIGGSPDNSPFSPTTIPGLPTRDDVTRWYSEVAGWDPRTVLAWGDAFHGFRGSVIMQGIAARYALRQASSARAGEYAKQMKPFALTTWEKVKIMQDEADQKARL
ncbi:hypothetical protein ACJ72_03707 [Emergomyces africanus]|uniref:Aminoglycoside phosphotransferase domain-containing protein n=1 Tax=Emergomyces africanus TaxID=1955775 RepID=A0A1B7NYU0_9EURO|nr:hypothetical protein ACJ72_03707 [Emergomyces africanus]